MQKSERFPERGVHVIQVYVTLSNGGYGAGLQTQTQQDGGNLAPPSRSVGGRGAPSGPGAGPIGAFRLTEHPMPPSSSPGARTTDRRVGRYGCRAREPRGRAL